MSLRDRHHTFSDDFMGNRNSLVHLNLFNIRSEIWRRSQKDPTFFGFTLITPFSFTHSLHSSKLLVSCITRVGCYRIAIQSDSFLPCLPIPGIGICKGQFQIVFVDIV